MIIHMETWYKSSKRVNLLCKMAGIYIYKHKNEISVKTMHRCYKRVCACVVFRRGCNHHLTHHPKCLSSVEPSLHSDPVLRPLVLLWVALQGEGAGEREGGGEEGRGRRK